MKRTAILFAIAGGLGLFALVLGFAPALPLTVATPVPTPITLPAPGLQSAGDSLKLTASLSDPYLLSGGSREVFLKLDLEAIQIAGRDRAPVNLALVLDRSGSMAGEKIENARKAARQLVAQLNEKDRFALITFGSDVTTLISSAVCTPEAKQRMYAAIDGIYEVGGTNISGGVEAGLAEVAPFKTQYSVSRVILMSDGQANEGIITQDGLSSLGRRVSGDGVTLSSIGVGIDFNEHVMEAMAEYGSGSYHFLSDADQLAAIFDAELKQAVATVAALPSLTIQPMAGASIQEVYGYITESSGSSANVRLPDFSSGQHRKVVVRMLVPAGSVGVQDVAGVSVAYADVTKNRAPGSASVQVSASVTTDLTLVTANRSKDVAAAAVHANALKMFRSASTSYGEGRTDEADKSIREARRQIQQAEVDYGKNAAFDEDQKEAEVFQNSLSAPAGSAAASTSTKRIHNFSNYAR